MLMVSAEHEILKKFKSIAVVGCSAHEEKPSHFVPKYLQEHGYRIIPINPNALEILGEKVFPSLEEAAKKEKIEAVDVFRPSEEAEKVTEQAIKAGAKAVWLQEGIESDKAKEKAEKAGILFVQNKCMKKELEKME